MSGNWSAEWMLWHYRKGAELNSSLACPTATSRGEQLVLAIMGICGKLGCFPAALQGVEQPQMLYPDWSWKFEEQLNSLMFVL